ncbi:heat shock 70 kDa protein 12B-like [Dreissena polymorpha]|uniref:heat shock 70 kDa protein 12B-like n=1 Tax=Dreissena polymorpha TaxID=45954 RepID=UPI002265169D|nr:heat shock 70 kDa protein 12B-like [Dreissena polymorpha]
MAKAQPLIVAAIDFGTTYSGWTFSFRHDFEKDPTKVEAKIWRGGQLSSLKGPTCILIQTDGETLEAIGFEAEKKYCDLAESEEDKDWFYFHRFKMDLWDEDDELVELHESTELEDVRGRTLPALTVFSLFLGSLKEDAMSTFYQRIAADFLDDEEIHWIITIPAIWIDAAKSFMRRAAEKVFFSIKDDNLSTILHFANS